MKVEVVSIKHQELLGYYQITLRFTDPEYFNADTGHDDPEIHTICYKNFICRDKDDIQNSIEREVYDTWLQYNSGYTEEEIDIPRKFDIDSETGEIL